jgi:hypothetical protein
MGTLKSGERKANRVVPGENFGDDMGEVFGDSQCKSVKIADKLALIQKIHTCCIGYFHVSDTPLLTLLLHLQQKPRLPTTSTNTTTTATENQKPLTLTLVTQTLGNPKAECSRQSIPPNPNPHIMVVPELAELLIKFQILTWAVGF